MIGQFCSIVKSNSLFTSFFHANLAGVQVERSRLLMLEMGVMKMKNRRIYHLEEWPEHLRWIQGVDPDVIGIVDHRRILPFEVSRLSLEMVLGAGVSPRSGMLI